jgi:hypothetical protein
MRWTLTTVAIAIRTSKSPRLANQQTHPSTFSVCFSTLTLCPLSALFKILCLPNWHTSLLNSDISVDKNSCVVHFTEPSSYQTRKGMDFVQFTMEIKLEAVVNRSIVHQHFCCAKYK